MDGDNKPALVALRRRREEVIDWLSEQFADDTIGLDEFEQRLDRAHSATDLATLDQLVADLAPIDSDKLAVAKPDPEPEVEQSMVLARPESKTNLAIFGALERKGAWRVAERQHVYCIMGGAELDFREAILPPGVTELRITAIMGGVDIIVPPDLAVECDGWAIFGAFEDMGRAPAVPDPAKPLLRITGYAIMGAFEIQTRLPGETARDARKRRKRERKAKRKLAEADRKQLGDGSD